MRRQSEAATALWLSRDQSTGYRTASDSERIRDSTDPISILLRIFVAAAVVTDKHTEW